MRRSLLVAGIVLALEAVSWPANAQDQSAETANRVRQFQKLVAATVDPADRSEPLPAPVSLSLETWNEVGQWYSANVRRTSEWVVYSYTPSAVILVDTRPRLDGAWRLQGKIRIEQIQPQLTEDMSWRSALLDISMDCSDGASLPKTDGGPIVSLYLGTIFFPGSTGNYLREGEESSGSIELFEGQNLSGASERTPVRPETLVYGDVGAAVAELCSVALASWKDSRQARRSDRELVGRDSRSLADWASRTLELRGWSEPVFGSDSMTFSERSDGQRLRVRTEFYDPALTVSVSRAKEATRASPDPPHSLIYPGNGRAIWIRSRLTEWNIDCARGTAGAISEKIYVEHKMRDLAEEYTFGVIMRPVDSTSEIWPHFASHCGLSS